MTNATHWIESNLALLVVIAIILLAINLLVMLVLRSGLAELRQEIKAMNLFRDAGQRVISHDLAQHEALQSSQTSSLTTSGQGLPNSLLIEKAIALIKAEVPTEQIKSDLGIDDNYLEILVKQHKA